MSEQQEEKRITKEQAIAVVGTLLTSGVLDMASHWNLPTMLGGAVVVYAAGKLTPEIMKMLIPGSDPESTASATQAVVNLVAPAPDHDDLPQDALSKLKRLARITSKPSGSQDVREDNEIERPQPEKPTTAKGKPSSLPLSIPAQFKLDSALDVVHAVNADWQLYFGQNGAGEVVSISIDDMYHVLDVSSSGKGKSNRFRLAMMQLVSACEVYYINPLANRIKAVKDNRKIEVWAPIFDRLANSKPMRTAEEIEHIMAALLKLIEDRYKREEAQDFSWKDEPVFVFIDELPEIFARCPDAVEKLDRIGRMGRQFGVFAYVASQTAQVNEIGQSTAAQAQYKTRVYGGGDTTSSKRLMKQTVSDEYERALQTNGAGLTVMLAEGMAGMQFVRAPLVTNEALFEYFGLDFNLQEWLPNSPSSNGRRGNVLKLPDTTASSSDLPQSHHKDVEQPREQKPAMTEQSRHEGSGRSDEATTTTSRRPGAGLPKILRDALNAYIPGTSYRELGAKLGYNDGEAREIWLELKRRGLLHLSVGTKEGTGAQPHIDSQKTGTARTLYSVPTPLPTHMEDLKPRPIDPSDLAKAFVLWQGGAASVRKLEAAAKEAKYGWSNGKVRLLIEEMEDRQLITKREAGVV